MLVPLSFVKVTPSVSTFNSVHDTPELRPPQPANENTGFVTGWLNFNVTKPRPSQTTLAKQLSFVVVSLSPGSVTRPVATNMPSWPPRSASDSVTS